MSPSVITQITSGVVSVLLLGGTLLLLGLGRAVPEWLVGFDGAALGALGMYGTMRVQSVMQGAVR